MTVVFEDRPRIVDKEVTVEPIVITTFDEIKSRKGELLGVSDWVVITQAMIDKYADDDVSGDHNWIHTDPVRCKSGRGLNGLSTTIAHGALISTRAIGILSSNLTVSVVGLRYGNLSDKTSYRAAVPVGSQARVGITLGGVQFSGDRTLITFKCDTEILPEGSGDPVIAAATEVTIYAEPIAA